MENLALFISGGGTTATAIINETIPGRKLDCLIRPALVVASNNKAKGIERVLGTRLLREKDVIVICPRDFATPFHFGAALTNECKARGVTLFGQYGWMVKTPQNFLDHFPRGVNQHPAPLCPGKPDFGGKGMYGRRCHFARLMFVRMTNRNFYTSAIAQQIHPEYDKGLVYKESQVEILSDDDVETLQARVLPVEHRVQIDTLMQLALDKVELVAPRELVLPHEMPIWTLVCHMAKLAYPKG